jgi:hypothetical protein
MQGEQCGEINNWLICAEGRQRDWIRFRQCSGDPADSVTQVRTLKPPPSYADVLTMRAACALTLQARAVRLLRYRLETSLARETELIDSFETIAYRGFANPERIGCPG